VVTVRRKNELGYSTAFWALFMVAVVVPMMALLWDVGRYMDLRGELQMAADAAAIAAVQEVDIAHFENSGEVHLSAGAVGAAYAIAGQHFGKLAALGYRPHVAYVSVNQQNRTVHVGLGATLHIFFPGITPTLTVFTDGMAQARMATR